MKKKDIVKDLENIFNGDDTLNPKNEGATERVERSTSSSKQELEAILRMLQKRYDFINVDDQLYIYNEELGYWKLIPDSNANREIRRLVSSLFFASINKSSLSELYEWLLLEAPAKDESIFFEKTNYINFRDTAYNWVKDKYVTDRKKLYFRYCLDIDFPKDESSGRFKEFLNDIFKSDKDSRREFSKFIGLAISDIRNLKYMMFMYGPSNTGKTVTQNLLEYIVGRNNCASLSFSQMSSEFAITQLIGKRLCISGEVSGATTTRLDIIKSITGNDKVTACYKGKDHFQFRSNCLLAFACNCFPKISDFLEVQAFLERVIIFPFVNVKDRSEWDKNLLEKLKQDTAGIIKFAINGLQALREDGYVFKESKAMKDCKRYLTGIYDSFSLFSDKYLEASKDSVIRSQEISEMYRKFCDKNDYHMLADNQWSQILKRNFVCYSTTSSVKNGSFTSRVRSYSGIKFKDTISELSDNAETEDEAITEIPEGFFNNK